MKKKQTATKKQRSTKLLKRFAWGVLALLAFIGFIGVGYYFGYVEALQYTAPKTSAMKKSLPQGVVLKESPKEVLSKKEQAPRVSNLSLDQDAEGLKERLRSVPKEEQNEYTRKGASHEYEEESLDKPEKEDLHAAPKEALQVQDKASKIDKSSQKKAHAKLAIIIDDLSFQSEVDAIKKLKLNLTMSFLPPNRLHPDSALLAEREPFYMVHLPLQAVNFKANEPLTLKVDDSQDLISQRVDDVVKLFPRVKYINNHTGSKFTGDENAMHKLMVALRSHNIEFIDSRTIGQTKVPKVMREFGEKYRGRDVFLDHAMDLASVKKQIKEAVKIAKKRGYAIAIGHPHPNTLKALRESKDLLQEVELVQINRI